MDAVQPTLSDFTVYVERIVEPYTGEQLVGVGGYTPHDQLSIHVQYDSETAVIRQPKDRHFSTQLPLEDAQRIRIVAFGEFGDLTLYDQALEAVGVRSAPAVEKLGFVARSVRSVTTGEVLSSSRWVARLGRLRELVRKVRHKIQYKLLADRFRPRSLHAGYVERTVPTAEPTAFRYLPVISILMPVYNVRADWLREAINSVREQYYHHWELCIADDASTWPSTKQILDELPSDPRIKLVRRTTNGHICTATNSAAELATGDFIALLDNDDRLAPHALLEVVRRLNADPLTDVVYSDEDKIDEFGVRYDPQFKPDWSPELLLSYNYINHFTVIRRRLFEQLGRFRVGYEGSQDHDLLLRVTEKTDRIQHIPQVLYHWRAHQQSTAQTATQKPIVHTSGRRAVADALQRRKIDATIEQPPFAAKLGLPILSLDGPDSGPSVAIIIRGSAADAGRTTRAIKANTAYRNFTVYLVLDSATTADALNRMAAARNEDYLLFLAAGLEPNDPRWLSRLMMNVRLPGVGAVGGLIRNPNGTIVSGGTALGMLDGTSPGHVARGTPADQPSYYFYAEVTRTIAATAPGCLLTSRKVFDTLGGFDADRFGESLYDVDFCMRLRGMGKRVVHVGSAEFRTTRLENPSERNDDPLERRAFLQAYGRGDDPYGNPNCAEANAFALSGDVTPTLVRAARQPLRALVAAHNLNSPEGAPRYLSEIVLGLRKRQSIAPSIWSPLGGAGEATYTSVDVPVTIANESWSQRFVDGQWTRNEYDAAQNHLQNQLTTTRPDVVIANTLLTFPMVEAAARVGTPCVWIIHESYNPDVLARLFTPFARWRAEAAFSLASRVVPASHDTAALFAHLNTRGNFRVLHNGIPSAPFDAVLKSMTRSDAVRELGGDPSQKRIISVGTVCERKGQHTLVEAAAKLAQSRNDFVVDIVGLRDVVPYAAYVRQLVQRRGLTGVVNLIPETDRVAPYFRAADVFVCTSHLETFSRSVLEAEAFGLPIVSTPCAGVSEQVAWDYNALDFPIGNSDALAAALERVLADDALRASMARRSRAMFETHLSYDEMLDRYDAVIRTAAGKRETHQPSFTVLKKAA